MAVGGCETAASVAYRANAQIVIHPITPSAVIWELTEEGPVRGRNNLLGRGTGRKEHGGHGSGGRPRRKGTMTADSDAIRGMPVDDLRNV